MAIASGRLARRVERDFGSTTGVAELLAELDGERLQAAAVLSARGDMRRLRTAVALAKIDWRDLLVGGGLGNDDWPEVLERELGAPAD